MNVYNYQFYPWTAMTNEYSDCHINSARVIDTLDVSRRISRGTACQMRIQPELMSQWRLARPVRDQETLQPYSLQISTLKYKTKTLPKIEAHARREKIAPVISLSLKSSLVLLAQFCVKQRAPV